MERPGEVQFNIETLIRLAAALKVGLIVKFAPYSEVLNWNSSFSQDEFDVVQIGDDQEFLDPPPFNYVTDTATQEAIWFESLEEEMKSFFDNEWKHTTVANKPSREKTIIAEQSAVTTWRS